MNALKSYFSKILSSNHQDKKEHLNGVERKCSLPASSSPSAHKGYHRKHHGSATLATINRRPKLSTGSFQPSFNSDPPPVPAPSSPSLNDESDNSNSTSSGHVVINKHPVQTQLSDLGYGTDSGVTPTPSTRSESFNRTESAAVGIYSRPAQPPAKPPRKDQIFTVQVTNPTPSQCDDIGIVIESVVMTPHHHRRCGSDGHSFSQYPVLKVIGIVEGSLTHKDGRVKIGDEIVDINGQSMLREDSERARRKTIIDHASSTDHKLATASEDPYQEKLHTVPVDERDSQSQYTLKQIGVATAALETAYYCVMEEIPNCKFKSLQKWGRYMEIKRLIDLRVAKNAQHDSPEIFNELLGCLSRVIEEDLKLALSKSPVVGIGLDESTDRAAEKHCVFIVRYVHQSKIKTTYLKMEKIEKGTADAIYQTILLVLNHYSIPTRKVMSVGSDGAAVMVGRTNGVVTKLKNDNPFCIAVHCVCHRLHLAVSQVSNEIPDMKTLTNIVLTIYSHIQLSSNRLQAFKDIASLLEVDAIKFKALFDVRWLSLGECILAIIKNYEPLLVLLSQEADEGLPTAVGLFQQLSSYKYCALLHLVADILTVINHLSKIFQHRDVCFHAIRDALHGCLIDLNDMITNDHVHLAAFKLELQRAPVGEFKGNPILTEGNRRNQQNQQDQFEAVRVNLLNQIIANLERRFPQVDLLDAMQIFDATAFPDTQADLTHWGNEHLDTLLEHFGQSKYNTQGIEFAAPLDPVVFRQEFLPFKRLMYMNKSTPGVEGGLHYLRPTELFEKLFDYQHTDNLQLFPSMYKLMSMCLIVMIGNAEAERAFSVQNLIKTKTRNTLAIVQLDRLIRVNYAKLGIEEFDFRRAALFWLQQKWRRL